MAKKTYKDSDIKVLKGLEAVRKRPAMYIADPTAAAGVLQSVTETVDNSKDEYLAGYCNHIKIALDLKNHEVVVADNGRGIPQKSIVTIFGTLHAGGKFDNDAYKVSGGLHGVGSAVVNALSIFTNVYSKRGKKVVCAKFKKGKTVKKEHRRKPPTTKIFKASKIVSKNGTIVHFKPDFSILKHGKLPAKHVVEWLSLIPLLCPKLKVELTLLGGKVNGKRKFTFFSKKGLAADKRAKDFYLKSGTIDALVKPMADDTSFKGYVNLMPVDDGVHAEAFWQAYKAALQHVVGNGRKKKLQMPKSKTLRTTCSVVLHVLVSDPLFIGQTKDKLGGKEVKKAIAEELKKALTKYFNSKKSLARKIVNFATKVESFDKAQKAELKSMRELQKKARKGKLPASLAVSSTRKPKDRELFLVEGESAAGNCKIARDNRYQEVLPLKGKILNVERAKPGKIASSNEVQDILLAIGGDKPETGRIGKVFIFADADADGKHIQSLIITAFLKLLPEWVEEGRLWVVKPPLFHTIHKGRRFFGNTLKEVESKVPKSCTIMRAKGLGECRADDLKFMAFDEKTRDVEKLVMTDQAAAMVSGLMGKAADDRRSLIGLE